MFVAVALMFVAAVIGKAWANPETTISISPSKVDSVATGQTFTVDVAIADVTNLYGWQINVTFNPSVLNANRISEGPFLKGVNETAWPKPVIDNAKGYIFASALLMPPYPPAGATGSGTLANITFSVKSGGSSALHLDPEKTYLRSVESGSGVIVPIEGIVRQDGNYGGGGGGITGVSWELIAGVVVVVVVVVVVGVFLLRRRRS